MAENKLADLSMNFAVSILKVTDGIKEHYSLINQLERSATSIGENIREAKYAHSKSDFTLLYLWEQQICLFAYRKANKRNTCPLHYQEK